MKRVFPGKYDGNSVANASKSMMQRVVAAAILTKGITTIHNPGNSHDCRAALNIAKDLGVRLSGDGSIILDASQAPQAIHQINCGESGLGIRMFTPILCLLENQVVVNGEGSLLNRPLDFFETVLPKLGVQCSTNSGKVPISVKGPLKAGEITLDGSLTSQFLTGLLMALPLASVDSVIHVDSLKSKGYVDLTIQVLKTFGVEVQNENYETFHIPGGQSYQPCELTIEGDWSGAAFHIVGAAISGRATLSALNIQSLQPDQAILMAIQQAGGIVEWNNGSLTVRKDELKCFEFDATDCPDLFPPLAALGANCRGISRIRGIGRLTHKESNRALTIQQELWKVGIRVELRGDIMEIEGGSIASATLDSQNDHRIAMMASTLAINAKGPICITNSSAINKSYPDFFQHLGAFGIKTTAC